MRKQVTEQLASSAEALKKGGETGLRAIGVGELADKGFLRNAAPPNRRESPAAHPSVPDWQCEE